MRRTLFFLQFLFLITIPNLVFSAPLVACTGTYEPDNPDAVVCGTQALMQTIFNVFGFLTIIASIIATIILVYIGLQLVTSGGSTEVKQKAKKALVSIGLGLIFIIGAFAIIDVVFRVLVPAGSPVYENGGWYSVLNILPAEPHDPPPPRADDGHVGGDGGDTLGYSGSVGGGVQCYSDNTACSVDALIATGMSVSQANVMSCIAMTESSGNPGTTPYNWSHPEVNSTACGTFQVTQTTWKGAAVGSCSDFYTNCRNAECNAQVTQTLVSRNGYSDWTCPGCNNNAQGCVDKYGSI